MTILYNFPKLLDRILLNLFRRWSVIMSFLMMSWLCHQYVRMWRNFIGFFFSRHGVEHWARKTHFLMLSPPLYVLGFAVWLNVCAFI